MKKKGIEKYLVTLFIFLILLSSAGLTIAQDDKLYLEAPGLIETPEIIEKYPAESRKFTGIPSLAVSRDGRLWATWYAGITPEEDKNNYVVVATSGDNGDSWEEVLVIEPVHDQVRAYDPEIWIDPDGKLWVFWAQATYIGGTWALITEGTSAGVWAITTENPDISEPVWSEPGRLTDGVMMCKPLVLSSGEWVLPVSIWEMTDGSAQMVFSNDRGNSWHVRGGASVPEEARSFDEHMIVERKDGSLWMLIRTRYGIGQSISNDHGKTWCSVTPSLIQHPTARFFIRRLNSGNLLLVKHGPIDMRVGRS
ncbi:MAG: sialidase family protein, partial [Bacteroidales bacterium]